MVEDRTEYLVKDKIRDAIWVYVHSQVVNHVLHETYMQVSDQLSHQVHNQIEVWVAEQVARDIRQR